MQLVTSWRSLLTVTRDPEKTLEARKVTYRQCSSQGGLNPFDWDRCGSSDTLVSSVTVRNMRPPFYFIVHCYSVSITVESDDVNKVKTGVATLASCNISLIALFDPAFILVCFSNSNARVRFIWFLWCIWLLYWSYADHCMSVTFGFTRLHQIYETISFHWLTVLL